MYPEPHQIKSIHLKAIDEVLALVAPDLRHHVHTVARRGPVKPDWIVIGQGRYKLYVVDMRADDAKAILCALQEAAKQFGETREFLGVSLGILLAVWMQHEVRLRAMPQ